LEQKTGISRSVDLRFPLLPTVGDPLTFENLAQFVRVEAVPDKPATETSPPSLPQPDKRRLAKAPKEVLQPADALGLK
jgi:hypothetical protein